MKRIICVVLTLFMTATLLGGCGSKKAADGDTLSGRVSTNGSTSMETVIGSSMEIPKEVLVKKYESNYTAARAALLDFWRTVRVYRTRFNTSFNQPIYEQWLSEAVATGRIDAPGFFDDPAVRLAWCGCSWMGASMGHVDPLKEVNAAEVRIRNNITTEEQEAMEYNGNDRSAIVRSPVSGDRFATNSRTEIVINL